MPFQKQHFQKITASLNDEEPRGWTYTEYGASINDMLGEDYFEDAIEDIANRDFLYIRANLLASLAGEFFTFKKYITSGVQHIIAEPMIPKYQTVETIVSTPLPTFGSGNEEYDIPLQEDELYIIRATLYLARGILVPATTYEWRLHTVTPDVTIAQWSWTYASPVVTRWEVKEITPPIQILLSQGLRCDNIASIPHEPADFTSLIAFQKTVALTY